TAMARGLMQGVRAVRYRSRPHADAIEFKREFSMLEGVVAAAEDRPGHKPPSLTIRAHLSRTPRPKTIFYCRDFFVEGPAPVSDFKVILRDDRLVPDGISIATTHRYQDETVRLGQKDAWL